MLHLVDLVLVMSVDPGFSGGTYIPETVEKVAEIRHKLDEIGSSAWLEVDGGIYTRNPARDESRRCECLCVLLRRFSNIRVALRRGLLQLRRSTVTLHALGRQCDIETNGAWHLK